MEVEVFEVGFDVVLTDLVDRVEFDGVEFEEVELFRFVFVNLFTVEFEFELLLEFDVVEVFEVLFFQVAVCFVEVARVAVRLVLDFRLVVRALLLRRVVLDVELELLLGVVTENATGPGTVIGKKPETWPVVLFTNR